MQSEAPKGATGWCAIAGAIDGAIAPNAPAWLRAWVQHNFRRALLLPSREENINSLGAAIRHNFRRTLLLPSREEIINSLGAAVWGGGYSYAWALRFGEGDEDHLKSNLSMQRL